MQYLRFPLSTGQVCRLLQTPEHRIINPIRQGKLDLPNVGGRRLWSAENVRSVAHMLGKDSAELRNFLAIETCSECTTPRPNIIDRYNGGSSMNGGSQ